MGVRGPSLALEPAGDVEIGEPGLEVGERE
jgi:hypothetical protein